MSIRVMTMVFDRYPVGGSERLLALALSDHARDDGTRIWPSLDELARKTLQSRSTVQRQIAKMQAIGWLERVSERTGRGHTNEYRISGSWIAGAELVAPPPVGVETAEVIHKGCQSDTLSKTRKGVTQDVKGVTQDVKGVTAMTPESSEPSITITPLPPDGGASTGSVDNSETRGPSATPVGFDAFATEYPKRVDMAQAEREWRRLKPDAALQGQIVAAVIAQRDRPEWREDDGRWIPKPGKWLRAKRWLDEIAPTIDPGWWRSAEGVREMGARQDMPFSLASLGAAYTDDQRQAHWRSYRASVFAAAGQGPWSEARTA